MSEWYTDEQGRRRPRTPAGRPYREPNMEIHQTILLSDMVKSLEGAIDSLERSAAQHGSLFVGDLKPISSILSDAKHVAIHQHSESALQELDILNKRVEKAIRIYNQGGALYTQNENGTRYYNREDKSEIL